MCLALFLGRLICANCLKRKGNRQITLTLSNGLFILLKEIHTSPIISHWASIELARGI
jgi:hypothetical protein